MSGCASTPLPGGDHEDRGSADSPLRRRRGDTEASRFLRAAGLAVLCGLPAPAVQAAGDPSAAKGIVAEHCTRCHEVPGFNPGGALPTVDAPPFQAIADAPDEYTPERLRRFLIKPHFPMSGFTLSASDIENLIAFISSLRQQ